MSDEFAVRSAAHITVRSIAPRCATRGDVGAEEKIRFTSSILPKWARRDEKSPMRCCRSFTCVGIDGHFQKVASCVMAMGRIEQSRPGLGLPEGH